MKGSRLFFQGLVLLGMAGALLFQNGISPADTAQAASPAAATVQMTNDLTYEPRQVTIQAGQTIKWENPSRVAHTVTADASLAQNPAHVALPPGAEPFNSGDIPPGESWSYTFTAPGNYRYFCIPHETMGMIGEVTVTPAR